jgi:hypothetical protein
MQHDAMKPEDLDSSSEYHAIDSLRYSLMARPWQVSIPVQANPVRDSWDRAFARMADGYDEESNWRTV